MREVEEPLLRVVLRHADGNQTRAAEILGITRATLRRKLRDLGLAAD
jgi:Fis family transcriptional regulator